ncbi:MAG: hypothetical protein ACTSYQ_02850 [Candidatus Odinarchaeia archaeon]
MSEIEVECYKDALKKINDFLIKIRDVVFHKYPSLLKGDELKSKIKEIDNVQKKIDEVMIQFKKLFTEKLLVLTAMRSLIWHFKSTIKDSESTKEIKDRIRIFIIPELERFLNSFKRENILINERIKPIMEYFSNIQEVVQQSANRQKEFEKLIKLDSDNNITILEKMINLILDDKLEEVEKLISNLGKKPS